MGRRDIKSWFERTPEQNLRASVEQIIAFVESDEYLPVAAEVERLAAEEK